MKLCWFHLMPYTDLPADFQQEHPGVWVDVDSRLFDPAKAHAMYNEFLDELEFADAMGFDGICVNEHHANGYGLMPSPNLMAAALARRTRDAALIVMGNSLALYNPPLRVAEEFAMLDCISGGRLVAGFPVGTPMDTCFAYGQNPSQLRARYHEAHDLILRAWTEPDTFAWNGRYNQQRYVNPWPRPLQKPHPPIWIPGGGSVETWRWCAERDYVYSYLSYFGYQAGRATMRGFWDEMERLGKDRNPYRAGFLQFVGVADTHAEAVRLYREPAEYFYGRCLHLDPRWVNPPGYTSEATIRARVQSMVAQAAAAQASGPAAGGHRARLRGDSRAGLRGRGRPGRGGGQAARDRPRPQRRPPHAAAAVRQHGPLADAAQHGALRQARAPADPGSLRRRLGGSLVAEAAAGVRARGAGGHRPMIRPWSGPCRVNGLPCRVWESGTGEPLAFLAGFGGLSSWPPFLTALATRRRVVVPSLPGFPGALGHDRLDDIADWIAATLDLLDAAGLGVCDLVGASVGGMLAAEVAAFCRPLVRRLALLAPLGLFDPAEPVTDVFAQTPGTLPALLSARPERMGGCLGPGARARTPWRRRSSRPARRRLPHACSGRWAIAASCRRLHRITAPTLLLWGAQDRVVPPTYAKRFTAGIAGPTSVCEIAGAGHLSYLDQPDAVAEAVLRFLA